VGIVATKGDMAVTSCSWPIRAVSLHNVAHGTPARSPGPRSAGGPRSRRNSQAAAPRESERERRARKKAEDGELPADVRDELHKALGTVPQGSSGGSRSRRGPTSATVPGALTELRVLVRLAPDVGAVRELNGLTLYRLGRWREAVRELRAFHELTGSFDQHPVIADCERALGHDKAAMTAWDALRQAGVDREVLVEGRLVVAGMLADRGDLEGAIALLGPGGSRCAIRTPAISGSGTRWRPLRESRRHAQGRELFERVASFSTELFDVEDRLAALR